MNYHIENEQNQMTVYLSGRLSFSENQTFRGILEKIQSYDGERCVFDLSDLEFIDSAGLGMLMLLKDASNGCPFTIILKGADGQVKRMLEIAKFSNLIPMED